MERVWARVAQTSVPLPTWTLVETWFPKHTPGVPEGRVLDWASGAVPRLGPEG